MYSFNLIDQPWIPVRMLDGERVSLSLRDVLIQADQVRTIEDASPLTQVALHRFLLAVLHRALEGPKVVDEAADWFQNGLPAQRIERYLELWNDRFDLFHPHRPFLQVPGLDQVARSKPWTLLLPEEGSNNTSLLFNHSLRDGYIPTPASPAEAARGLITYQTFVLGGLIKVFLTSAPGGSVAQAALVTILGETVRETLCLNLVPYRNTIRDVPVWEQDGVLTVEHMRGAPTKPATGHVSGYTWPNRSLLLVPETVEGRAVVCSVFLGAGVRMEESEAYRTDPMAAYRYHDKWGLRPVGFRPGRGFWRDFSSLLPHKPNEVDVEPQVMRHARDLYRALGQRARPPKPLVAGLSNDRAKIEQWRAELFELPSAILHDRDVYEPVKEALERAEEGGRHLYGATSALAKGLLSSGRDPATVDVRNVVQTLPGIVHYWSTLETNFSSFLSSLTPEFDEDDVAVHWSETIYRTLRDSWELTVRAAGDGAAALRATAQAGRTLDRYMAVLYSRTHSEEQAV